MDQARQIAEGLYGYLKKHHSVRLLPAVIDRLSSLNTGSSLITVTSAVPLTDAEKKQLESILSRKYPDSPRYEYLQDPGLIAGVKISTPDEELDLSVRARLENYGS